ncbi:hypothetical protein [Nostoc sp.]|uniref:hypothetical protein n=1 Tax=Nostoc sp. TaxID=1180 RepID=UPI002FF22CF3
MTIFAQVYIDEDVDVLVATLLLGRGFDATSVSPIPHKATKPPCFVWCQLSKTWNQCQKADLTDTVSKETRCLRRATPTRNL